MVDLLGERLIQWDVTATPFRKKIRPNQNLVDTELTRVYNFAMSNPTVTAFINSKKRVEEASLEHSTALANLLNNWFLEPTELSALEDAAVEAEQKLQEAKEIHSIFSGLLETAKGILGQRSDSSLRQ